MTTKTEEKTPKKILESKKVPRPKKTLGQTSYKNSKQKKKLQNKKLIEKKKVVNKDRQLKSKIKHLEKELIRICKAITDGKTDKKNTDEKSIIEKKIIKLKAAMPKYKPSIEGERKIN